jgi:processing peptidase subunit alpha
MLFMNLEQRPVQFEDVARQVLFRGKRENSKYYFDRIETVQEADIRRVATKIISTKPAVAALGNIHPHDPYERVKKIFGMRNN